MSIALEATRIRLWLKDFPCRDCQGFVIDWETLTVLGIETFLSLERMWHPPTVTTLV